MADDDSAAAAMPPLSSVLVPPPAQPAPETASVNYTRDQLGAALVAAHNAGDTDSAGKIAGMMKNKDDATKAATSTTEIQPDAGPISMLASAYHGIGEGSYLGTKYIAAAARAASSHLPGNTPQTYSEALTDINNEAQQYFEANPWSFRFGDAAGSLLGGNVISRVGSAMAGALGIGAKSAAAGEAASKVLADPAATLEQQMAAKVAVKASESAAKQRLVLGAATNAGIITGGEAKLEGGDWGDAALAAGAGFSLGGGGAVVARGVAGVAAPFISNAAENTRSAFARLVGLPGYQTAAEQVESHFNGGAQRLLLKGAGDIPIQQAAQAALAREAAGQQPMSNAEIIKAWSDKSLSKLAANSPDVSNYMKESSNASAKQAPENFRSNLGIITATPEPVTSADIQSAARSRWKDTMGSIGPDATVPLSSDEVNMAFDKRLTGPVDSKTLNSDDSVDSWKTRVSDYKDQAGTNAESGAPTNVRVADLDQVRRVAKDLKYNDPNKTGADLYSAPDQIKDMVSNRGFPQYGRGIAQYEQDMARHDAFISQAGENGQGVFKTPASQGATLSKRYTTPPPAGTVGGGGPSGLRDGLIAGLNAQASDTAGVMALTKKITTDLDFQKHIDGVLPQGEARGVKALAGAIQAGQKRADNVARVGGSAEPEADPYSHRQLVEAGLAAASGRVDEAAMSTARAGSQLMDKLGFKASPGVQARTAQLLNSRDPAVRAQGQAIMKRGQMSNADIRRISTYMAGLSTSQQLTLPVVNQFSGDDKTFK